MPTSIEIRSLPDFDTLITASVEQLESRLRGSLDAFEERSRQPIAPIGHRDVGDLNGDDISIGDLRDLQNREARGEDLSPKQKEQLQNWRAINLKVINSVINPRYRPEQRTPDIYLEQVDDFLRIAASSAQARLKEEFVSRRYGSVRLVLFNPTERSFEKVRFEIRLPPDAEVLFSIKDEDEMTDIPIPPRDYGVPTEILPFSSSFIEGLRLPPFPATERVNLNPTKVTYHSDHAFVTLGEHDLRPSESLALQSFT